MRDGRLVGLKDLAVLGGDAPHVWRAHYRDLDGKEHARHFDRKLDAQRWIDEVTASLVTGQYVDPRSAKKPFKEYAEEWRAI
ncbi:hypothetical protein [Streptomyces misionensis]|uniref:hypothetical protein n=1 Tax=Streptomyces misionensis TaxID=67331 RepID=UPI0033D7E6B8